MGKITRVKFSTSLNADLLYELKNVCAKDRIKLNEAIEEALSEWLRMRLFYRNEEC